MLGHVSSGCDRFGYVSHDMSVDIRLGHVTSGYVKLGQVMSG
jgi:hypothetical protein